MNDISIDTLKFNEIVKRIQLLDKTSRHFTSLKIGFLRNITIDSISTYLKLLCYEENIRVDTLMGEYDNVMQEVMNKESILYRGTPDIIVLCLKKENLCPALTNQFNTLSREAVDEKVNTVLAYFRRALLAIRKHSEAVVLVHNFETPVYPSFGILDYQAQNRQLNTFRRINVELLDIVDEHDSTYIVDIDLLQSLVGYSNFFDHRYWHIGRAPYSRVASKTIAQEYMKFVRALKGRAKKCLVLDCDNTLWGGIIGEDGINKIQIGKTYPGSAYLEFQHAILDLYNRGIILSMCSKNNEQDVLDVLENHPDMALRKEHFVAKKINWNDKVSNLKEIAADLNIGLDSLVFVDDSEFEINMARQLLPEVTAILLPGDPAQFADVLKFNGLFDTLSFSTEDRKRSEMYRADVSRKEALSEMKYVTVEEYYRYLEMEVFIKSADDFSIPRISQLTQRTNQFNLTTKRYSENDIRDLVSSRDADVRYLRLKDRFGDMGIVGVAILKYAGGDCCFDSFLLSCRVLGRGVEDVFLEDCIRAARKTTCIQIFGMYFPTEKNGQISAFYEDREFTYLCEKDGGIQYIFSLERSLAVPDYFKTVESDVE